MEAQVLKLGLVLGLLFLPISAWASPRVAQRIRARQHIRPEGPSTHGKKAGTPTMGGLVPLLLVLTGAGVLWGLRGPDGPSLFALVAMLLGGLIGLLDDLRSQRGRRSTGFFPIRPWLLSLAPPCRSSSWRRSFLKRCACPLPRLSWACRKGLGAF